MILVIIVLIIVIILILITMTTKTTKLERFAIVTGIAMAKESTDTQWDTNDILATCLGSLSANMLHGKF